MLIQINEFCKFCHHTEPTSPHNFSIILTHQESESPNITALEVNLYWNNVTDVNENVSYNFTIQTKLEELNRNFHILNTSWIQHTLYYNWEYNISVTATNCLGMSVPAEIYISWDGLLDIN